MVQNLFVIVSMPDFLGVKTWIKDNYIIKIKIVKIFIEIEALYVLLFCYIEQFNIIKNNFSKIV
jgi:hypothetical protein